MTSSPELTPSSASTHVPKSRITPSLRISTLPSFTTATCNPLRLKMIASAGTLKDGVGRGIFEFDGAVNPGLQSVVRIGNVDLSQERARTALQRVGDPGHLAGELTIWNFGYAHDGVNTGRHAEGGILRHVYKDFESRPSA